VTFGWKGNINITSKLGEGVTFVIKIGGHRELL
jgi:hypothetical protein